MTFKRFRNFRRRGGKARDARRTVIEKQGYGDNWPKQRARALKRDDYTCQMCGRKGKKIKAKNGRRYWDVHVHHKRKIKLFVNLRTKEVDYKSANDLDNLVVLCKYGCHQAADGHRKLKGFVPFG